MPSPTPPRAEQSADDIATTAHIDESSARLPDGRRLYGLAAVLTSVEQHATIIATLRGLVLPGRLFLHHYEETLRRRCRIAEAVAELVLDGAIILTETSTDQTQERARARLFTKLLPRLQHAEKVEHVIIESRARSDKLDRRTRDRLRQSHHITAELRVDHVRKHADPLLWLPDFVAGAWFSAQYHDQSEPWEIISAAHYIEVTRLHEEP